MPNHLCFIVFTCLAVCVSRAQIVISEIMYHPASELTAEEYVELHNTGAASVDVSGWQFTSGVTFTVPAATNIPAGGRLVVAANAAAFAAKYPAVTNFVAGWTGQLSNSSNTITLRNAADTKIDEVDYSDDGDWAERRRQDPPDHGHRGWVWRSDADGGGKSLELINAGFDNSTGQNWAASTVAEGTPGAVNSVAAANLAPVVADVTHFPLLPKSTETVSINARVVDDSGTPPAVTLHYRNDGAAAFTSEAMFDDGTHDDALAGDGIFGLTLAAQPNGTIVEFYFTATDGTLTRTWPAPQLNYDALTVQRCNLLYQVDDATYAGAQPTYRMILRAVDRTELDNINTDTGTPPFPYNPGEDNDQTHSHARFNATFISVDGTGAKLRYLTSVRNRGNGSRATQPQSLNVQFPNADTWSGLTSLNLNTQNTPWQLFGSALFRKAGLAGPESRAVQVRVNAANPATGTAAPAYGFYVCNEVQNSDFADHHFPLDAGGNIYRAQRFFQGTTTGGTLIPNGGDLEHHVPAVGETLTQVDLYKLNYRKESNASEDDWSDLLALTAALAKGHSGATPGAAITYDADYITSVQATADIAQFVRWFAVNALADNEETNLSNGDGDDYYLYFGADDPRAALVPYDLDTILGRSATGNVATHGIFRMIDEPDDGDPTPMNAFIKHPAIAPLYYAELMRLLDGPFAPAEFNALADLVLGGISPATPVTTMKTFNTARHAHVTTLVPRAITVTNSQTVGGTALTVVNGYPQSTAATCQLIGRAHAANTRSVKVDGVLATWSAWQAQWTAPSVALTPGVNRILVQAFDASGAEIDHFWHSVWYNDASETSVSGIIAANTTWTVAAGPYRVTANLTVASGATLTIEPGAVVYLNTDIDFTVASGGRLTAIGTETNPIRFMSGPGGAAWGGIIINGAAGTPLTTIAYAHIEGNGDDAIDVNAADVVLDHLTFGNTAEQYLSLDGASFLVSHCIFPSGTAEFELLHGTGGVKAGGRGIIRDCFLGFTLGYNDTFDFSGGDRPSPILQFINNVCIGGDDDVLDLDGTDTWVEGNVFMHVHRNGSPDSASAVSGGDGSGSTSEITIVGNLFYDVDQAATAKIGNFYTFLNNTVVDQNGRGSEDTVTAVLNFADEGTTEGAGMYVEGNVIHSAVALVRHYDAGASTVTFNNNLLPMAWTGPGAGNTVADARLVDPAILTPTERNFTYLLPKIRTQFALDDCSPAKGTGPNGADKGGARPLGVSLSGAPTGITAVTSATLTVGTLMTGSGIPGGAGFFPNGSGWTHYQWRFDGGAWSAETPLATPIALTGLANGLHTVEVIGKNDAGFYQNDAAYGSSARLTSATWTVDTAYVPPPSTLGVRISEVLALNTETLNFGTQFPDVIELHNAGSTTVDLAGWGLTDNTALPYKYTFSNGATIAPGAYLVIYASGSGSVPQPKTGFGLKREGDTLTLTRSPAAGGGVADAVPFGWQLADYSIGRCRDGSWALCVPTFGSANVLAGTAPVAGVKINEWLASAELLAAQDFIELHNPAALPVDIGGCHLTENPADWPDHFQIRQLTFLGPAGYTAFKCDDDEGQGPEHTNFKLPAEQGEIGFFDEDLHLLDSIVYGPQTTDVSQGRTPNGSTTLAFFSQPTPGAPNPANISSTSTANLALLGGANAWRYYQSATAAPANDLAGRDFAHPLYDDTEAGLGWATGTQLLYIEGTALPAAVTGEGIVKTTVLGGFTTTRPWQTYYFRTHFNYTGALPGGNVVVTLNAKVVCDDGCVIYLNGQRVSALRVTDNPALFASEATGSAPEVSLETFVVPSAALVAGDNVLAVSVHQVDTQSATDGSSDVTWAMKLDASVVTTIDNTPVVLNEVFPINATLTNPDASLHGWIELRNTSAADFDLSDMSLSNAVATPRRYVFPAGTLLPAGGHLVLQCDGTAAASATNTGFALAGSGGVVTLNHTLANGGALLDSVAYGRQIADFAVGRIADGTGAWTLTVPTRGAANSAAALGPVTTLRLNEWLAAPASGADFLELFNTGASPVPLAGNTLTDDLSVAGRAKFSIPALSFIGGSGAARWQNWIADADNTGTPGHVNFDLAAAGEALGLYTSAGVALDTVSFGAQTTGVARGRYPDGTSGIISLVPTPGTANVPGALDTDGDGIPDAWEVANGLNPNNPADAALDPDGDGLTTRAEYLAGTDPHDPISRLAAALVPSGVTRAVRFTALAGKTYTVEYKNAVTDAVWLKLADIPAQGVDTTLDVPDPAAAGLAQRFYRVVTPAVP